MKIRKFKNWIFFKAIGFFLPLSLSAVTINIINDSKFPLEVRIFEANKEPVGSAIIPGGGTYYTWMDSYHGASDWTQGPFTVQFFCPNGDEYGTIRHVTNGMTVRAQGASGPRKCSPSAESRYSGLNLQ